VVDLKTWVPRPCPRMPLWVCGAVGRDSGPGQGSALGRVVTTGKQVLTGENLPNGKT
jgi:hypothetical protein